MSFQNHPALATYHAELAARKAQGYKTEQQTRYVFQNLLENRGQPHRGGTRRRN